MNPLYFIVSVFAVWRLTVMLVNEVGPYKLVERFRNRIINEPWSPIHCFKCTSVWLAFPFALALCDSAVSLIALWFGLSGAAILIETWVRDHEIVITYQEEKK